MKLLKLTTLLGAISLCLDGPLGGDAAGANEIYGMTKFTFCGVPRTGGGASVTISSSAFSPGGARVALATDGRVVRICDTVTGRETASLAVPTSLGPDDEDVRFVAFNLDGTRLITASRERVARLWDIAGGRQLATLEHPSPIGFAAFSPDGARLVTTTRDRIARIWDGASGREIAVLEPPSPVTSAVFSPDGRRLVTTCWEGTAHIWDAATGREIAVLKGHEKKVTVARFSPNGAHVITASEDNTARIWDAGSGRVLRVLQHASRIFSVAFSADGTRVVAGTGKEARVFDAASGRERAVLKGHESDVNDAIFSPDGTRIATASDDNNVRVFDAGSGGQITVLKGPSGGAHSVAFAPDGQRIFSLAGVEWIMWTKLPAASLPDGVAGLWFGNFGRPGEPAHITRERCVRQPIKVNSNGLIVFFEAGSSDPPRPVLHLRCASDLTCQIFAGAPDQGLDAQGTGKLEVAGSAGKLCLGADCQPIARCPALRWTEQERKSGFAAKWDTEVHAPRQ